MQVFALPMKCLRTGKRFFLLTEVVERKAGQNSGPAKATKVSCPYCTEQHRHATVLDQSSLAEWCDQRRYM